MGCVGSKTTAQDDKIVRTGTFKQISQKYTINPEVLGTGQFGKVFLAHNTANPEVKVAIKTLNKKKVENTIE